MAMQASRVGNVPVFHSKASDGGIDAKVFWRYAPLRDHGNVAGYVVRVTDNTGHTDDSFFFTEEPAAIAFAKSVTE